MAIRNTVVMISSSVAAKLLPNSTIAAPVLSKNSPIDRSGMFAIAPNLARARAAFSVLKTVATESFVTTSINSSKLSAPIPN